MKKDTNTVAPPISTNFTMSKPCSKNKAERTKSLSKLVKKIL